MKVREVLYNFKDYGVIYNNLHKKIIINKAIDVGHFVALKNMLQSVEEEIKDIVVET